MPDVWRHEALVSDGEGEGGLEEGRAELTDERVAAGEQEQVHQCALSHQPPVDAADPRHERLRPARVEELAGKRVEQHPT
eukprot:762128-Hanusia_phi.AAC.17